MKLAAVKQTIRQFAGETFIFGLHLLRDHITIVEQIFWVIAVTILASLTICDLSNLVNTWLAEETSTFASRSENLTMYFSPPPTLYLPLESEKFSIDLGNTSAKTQNFISVYKQWRRSEISDEELMDTVDDDVAELMYAMLTSINEIDYRVSRGRYAELEDEKELAWAQLYEERPNFKAINKAVRDLFDALRPLGGDFLIDIVRVCGVFYCKKYALTGSFQKYNRFSETLNSTQGDLCLLKAIMHLDNEGVHVRVAASDLVFESLTDKLVLTAKKLITGNDDDTGTRHRRLWIDFAGGPGTDFERHSDSGVFLTPGHREEIKVSLSTYFIRYNRHSHPCSQDEKWTDCVEMCSANVTFKRCGCFQIYLVPYYRPFDGWQVCPGVSNIRNQTTKDGLFLVPFDSGCVPRSEEDGSHVIQSTAACVDKCRPDCETGAHVFSEIVHAEFPQDGYLVEVVIRSRAFPIFKEIPMLTIDTFLSRFGGSLGLWLGISFAALVHIPVFIMRIIAVAILNRMSETKTSTTQKTNGEANSGYVMQEKPLSFESRPDSEGILLELDRLRERVRQGQEYDKGLRD